MHARPEASAEVGRTCEDVAQTLVPHELPASLLDEFLHLRRKMVWKEVEQDESPFETEQTGPLHLRTCQQVNRFAF